VAPSHAVAHDDVSTLEADMNAMKTLPLFWLAVVPFVVGVGASEGQQHVPVAAACPAPADNTPLIAGLVTGQAISDEGSTTLRFSSDVRACGEWSNEVTSDECFDRWSFRITIPNSALAPGAYELAKIGASFGDLVVKARPEQQGCADRCGRMAVEGIGSISLEASPAKLVIHESADDGCITGTISDLRDPSFPDAPDFNGAFFAVRCEP
jgi:hypothetical protein